MVTAAGDVFRGPWYVESILPAAIRPLKGKLEIKTSVLLGALNPVP